MNANGRSFQPVFTFKLSILIILKNLAILITNIVIMSFLKYTKIKFQYDQ